MWSKKLFRYKNSKMYQERHPKEYPSVFFIALNKEINVFTKFLFLLGWKRRTFPEIKRVRLQVGTIYNLKGRLLSCSTF